MMRKQHVILRDSNGFNISDGRTRHVGVEYSLLWQLAPHWSIAFAGSEARHRYDFSLAVDGGETITTGHDIDTAPHTLQTLRANYRKSQRLRAELELQRVGPYFADAANIARYRGHELANLRLTWSLARAWELGARIDNLTNARYADRADFAQGDYRYFPGRPRSVFVQLDWRNF
jgi:outer membrane receptor protein involved in Fe transport